MKNLLASAVLLAFASVSAQTTTTTTSTTTKADGKSHTMSSTKVYDNNHTLSVYGSFPELNQVGLSLEFFGSRETKSMDDKSFSFYSSKVINVAYGMMNYDGPAPFANDIDGQGFVIDLGMRTYFKPSGDGLYFANYLSYGNIKFDENRSVFLIQTNFEGRYQYFSFFSPEVGYKVKLGPVAIDPFVGVMWKLEVKGQGDVDNRNVEEWMPRFGVKLGVNL